MKLLKWVATYMMLMGGAAARYVLNLTGISFATWADWEPNGDWYDVSYKGSATIPELDFPAFPLNGFAAGPVGSFYDLRLTDTKPIKGPAVQGDGVAVYGQLPEIQLEAGDVVEFDVILRTVSGYTFLTDAVQDGSRLWITTDANRITYNMARISLEVDGQPFASGSAIESGQFRLKANVTSACAFGTLLTRFSMTSYSNHSIANLKITKTNGDTYTYDLSGQEGDLIRNTDPVTGGPETDGLWYNVDDNDRVNIPDISRYYPVSSKGEDVQPDAFGGPPLTLVNVDQENNWGKL